MSNLDLAEASVEFTAGTEANWNSFALPIPNNVVIYTVDSKKFKKGDGSHRYSELPDGPSIAGIALGEQTLLNVLTQLIPDDEDSIIVIADEIYKASTTKLSAIVARLTAIANKDTIQDANMDAIANQFAMINSSITSGDVGKLAVIGNHQMKPGILPGGIVSVVPVSPINIRSFNFYSDYECTIPAASFVSLRTYYAKVNGCHDTADVDSITFTLTEDNNYVTVENLGRGKFKVVVVGTPIDYQVVFNATATYNTDTITVSKTMPLSKYKTALMSIFGGASDDQVNTTTVDSAGNIYVVGYTTSEGLGSYEAFIVKFDSNLNVLAKKRYGGTGDEYFYNASTDSSGNIYVVGYTASEGIGGNDALIVKFDSNLNILAKKRYGGTGDEYFYGISISSGNVYVVGTTTSDGVSALIVKFDSNLNVLAKKKFSSTDNNSFNGVTIDQSGNLYVVGYTISGSAGGFDALITKFDSNLNVLAKKAYVGSRFLVTSVDYSGNIYVVGQYYSELFGGYEALIVKFDSNLNLLAKKIYGGTNSDWFNNVTIDTSGNIIAIGVTNSEGQGPVNGIFIKFDSNLNPIYKKIFGGTGEERPRGVAVNSDNVVYVVGPSTSETPFVNNSFIIKLPENVPSGNFRADIMSGFLLADSSLQLSEPTLVSFVADTTLSDINVLTLADSNLTYADSSATFINDTITF